MKKFFFKYCIFLCLFVASGKSTLSQSSIPYPELKNYSAKDDTFNFRRLEIKDFSLSSGIVLTAITEDSIGEKLGLLYMGSVDLFVDLYRELGNLVRLDFKHGNFSEVITGSGDTVGITAKHLFREAYIHALAIQNGFIFHKTKDLALIRKRILPVSKYPNLSDISGKSLEGKMVRVESFRLYAEHDSIVLWRIEEKAYYLSEELQQKFEFPSPPSELYFIRLPKDSERHLYGLSGSRVMLTGSGVSDTLVGVCTNRILLEVEDKTGQVEELVLLVFQLVNNDIIGEIYKK